MNTIPESKTNPLPVNIRTFKRYWLKEEFLYYSDEQIEWLMRKVLRQNKKYISLNNGTFTF